MWVVISLPLWFLALVFVLCGIVAIRMTLKEADGDAPPSRCLALFGCATAFLALSSAFGFAALKVAGG